MAPRVVQSRAPERLAPRRRRRGGARMKRSVQERQRPRAVRVPNSGGKRAAHPGSRDEPRLAGLPGEPALADRAARSLCGAGSGKRGDEGRDAPARHLSQRCAVWCVSVGWVGRRGVAWAWVPGCSMGLHVLRRAPFHRLPCNAPQRGHVVTGDVHKCTCGVWSLECAETYIRFPVMMLPATRCI